MLLLELLLLVTAQLATCQQQAPENIPSPTFFISLTSVCRFNDVEMNPDTTFVAKGSLCAYAEQAGVMYSCPAGDPYCWNQGGTCSGGSNTNAGSNEIACSDIGSGNVNWCCNSQFGNCTQTPFQQNNCWSWFDNPNRNVNSLAASASASSVMQSAVSQPTVTNIVVQALADGGWVPAAASTTSSPSTSTSSTAFTTGSANVSQSPTSQTGSAVTAVDGSTSRAQPQSLSIGAIAGVVVGAAVIACASTALFFVWRSRQRSKNAQPYPPAHLGHVGNLPQSPLEYKDSLRSQTSELSSDQRPGIMYGQPFCSTELDSAAVQRPVLEKGHRDSRWSGRRL